MSTIKKDLIELSQLQIECLELLANGQTHSDISKSLSLSELTINLIISNALEKLNASSTSHAIAISVKANLINVPL